MDAMHRSATEVVRTAVAALEGERWDELVPLVRSDALQRLRDAQVRWMLELEHRAPRTPDELRAEQPWLPREVAAHYAEQEHKHVNDGLPALRAQWGVASFRELESLSPAEFFVRYLAASSTAARIRVAMAMSHKPPADAASALRAAEAAHRRRWLVVGEVLEGTRKAHVIYRELLGEGSDYDPDEVAGEVRVTTLDHIDGRWWLRIDHTLLDQRGWTFVWAPDEGDPTNLG